MSSTTNVLIDNATISSAFRALGFASCANKSVFDLDLANLSTIVDAVLFGDRVLVPRTYKPAYQQERDQLIAAAGMEAVNLENATESLVEQAARRRFSRWTMDYREDNLGLANELLRIADVYIRFVWNYRSSEYFLVLRAFRSQEGALNDKVPQIEGLLTELDRNIWATLDDLSSAKVIDSNGEEMTEKRVKDRFKTGPGTKKIMAALAWNVLRSIYYRILAASLDSVYMPHSLRTIGAAVDALVPGEAMVTTAALRHYGVAESRSTISDSIQSVMSASAKEMVDIGAAQGTLISLPPCLLGYVAAVSRSPEHFVENLARLRVDSRVSDLRAHLRAFETCVAANDQSGLRKWAKSIQAVNTAVKRELGLETTHFVASPLAYLTQGGISEGGIAVPVPSWLHRIIDKPSSWRLWYREVALTLQNVARLGDSYEKILGWAKFEKNDTPIWYVKKDYPGPYTKRLDSGLTSN